MLTAGMTRRTAVARTACAALATASWAAVGECSGPTPASVTPYDFGAVGDGKADDTVALQRAIRSASANRVVLDLDSGIFRVTGSCVAEGELRLINSGRAVIHAAAGRYADIGVLVVRGGAARIAAPASAIQKGAMQIAVPRRAGFAPGDLATVYNPASASFSRFRRYYRAGEFFEVTDVADDAVTLRRPLYSSYPANTVDLYCVEPVTGYMRDIVITSGGAPSSLIYIDYARGFRISNARLRQANNDCILFNRSVGCEVDNPDVMNSGDGGDDYGIVWANCQDCRVTGGKIYARRHAVAHGGSDQANSVPCRNIVIGGHATLRNDPASGTHCADFHGNCEACAIEDCTVFGGVGVGGKNNRVVRNAVQSMANGVAVLCFEVLGGRYDLLGNTFRVNADPQTATRGVIDFGGNAVAISGNTTETVTIVVKDCEFVSSALSRDSRLLNVRNRGARVKLDVEFEDNKFELNELGIAVYMDLVPGTGAAAVSDSIVVERNSSNITGWRRLHVDGDYSGLPAAHRQAGP
jgi:hypothetical protein